MAVHFRTKNGIVPALDVDSTDALKRVVSQTCEVPGIVGYKLGLSSSLRLGLNGAVQAIRSLTDLPVLYDHQKAGLDIPDMAAKFAAMCQEAGVDGLILFPVAGPTAVTAFVSESLKRGMLAVVGGDLPLPDYKESGGGYVCDAALSRIFALSAQLGAKHFVVPATDMQAIARAAESLHTFMERPGLFMPGIGALGGSITEAFAAATGCDRYAIVGRGIYGSSNPGEAAKHLADEALRFT